MRRMSDEISCVIPGRPGRFGVNVHFRAISCRCHRRIVSGGHDRCDLPQDPSTESATLGRVASALVVGQPQAALLHLLLEDTVLLHQVFDDVLLVAVDPSSEGHEQHLQGVEIGRHRPILSGLTPERVWGKGSAEYSDTTGQP